MTIEQQLGRLRRPAPPAVQPTVELGTGLVPGFSVYEAPVGEVAVVVTPRGVRSVRLVEELDPQAIEAKPPRAWGDRIRRVPEEGRPGTPPTDLRVTFRRKVSTRPPPSPRARCVLGWLASHVGKPGRPGVSAMATNPVPSSSPPGRPARRPHGVLVGGPRTSGSVRHEWDPERLEELAAAGVRFVGSDTTGIFCVPSCRHARRITPEHRLTLGSLDDARRAGLRPCQICEPVG